MTHEKKFRKILVGKCSHRSNLAIRRFSWQNGLLSHPTHQPPTVKCLRAREMICLPWDGSSRRKYARTFNDDSGNIETLYNFLFFIKTSKTKFKPATPEFSQVVNKGKLKKVKFKIFQILKKKTLNIHEISKKKCGPRVPREIWVSSGVTGKRNLNKCLVLSRLPKLRNFLFPQTTFYLKT